MPQVDIEAFVSVCGGSSGDRKIACEPLNDDAPDVSDVADVPPDFPPESFWLSKDAEFDWYDRNAFLQRKESTKGNANSTHLNPNSNSSSQRFSLTLKSKAAIIGLPKTQKTNYVDTKRRNIKSPNIRLFPPKRSESIGKSAAPMTEPSSPKVSCMGRVRSKKGRRKSTKTENEAPSPADRLKSSGGGKKTGLYYSLISLFRSDRRCSDKSAVKIDESVVKSARKKNKSTKTSAVPVSIEAGAEPPGLGGMTRFASGRKSESWSAEEMDVIRHDSTNPERGAAMVTGGST